MTVCNLWRPPRAYRSGRRRAGTTRALASAVIVATGCTTGSGIAPESSVPAKPAAGYTLSEKEKRLDCKKLRGRMNIAIQRLKSQKSNDRSSLAARATQGALSQIFGVPNYETDPEVLTAQETARLKAYNELLQAKKCPTVNLEDELSAP